MSSDTTKRRRVGEEGGSSGGDGIPPIGGGGSRRDDVELGDHQNDNTTSVHQELREMKSTMNELMGNMTNMMQMMQSQSNVINNMQGDIIRLTQKCNSMETTTKNRFDIVDDKLIPIKSRFDDVDNKLDVLEGSQKRVEDKLKYHERLLQNQKWVYSAPRPSPEYWDTLDEDETGEAEYFLNHIKCSTEEMRYGSGDGIIEIDADISYNEEFLPHWKEFAYALKQYHYHINHSTEQRDNSKLHLFNVKLPENIIDLLSNALESTYFQKIDLRNNNFGQKGIDFTLQYLRSNQTLNQFTLVSNPINSMGDINKLCQIVKEHPSIEGLTLDNCIGEDIDGYEMLKMILNAGRNKLQHVRLAGKSINTEGGNYISNFLATSTILESLHLQRNQLDDNDALSITKALKQNIYLRQLDLRHNNITQTGWKALRMAEFDNTSLNAAAGSNHICAIQYPPAIEGVDISEMNDNPLSQVHLHPRYIRQKKIYTVLSTRNRELSNVGHFEDIHVEILPDMLQSIQRYSHYRVGDPDICQGFGDVKPLSIVYEICRHWEESLAAFEALSLSK